MWHAGNDGTGTLAQPAQAEGANSFPPPPPPLLPVDVFPAETCANISIKVVGCKLAFGPPQE
jgi:hypothetical protein